MLWVAGTFAPHNLWGTYLFPCAKLTAVERAGEHLLATAYDGDAYFAVRSNDRDRVPRTWLEVKRQGHRRLLPVSPLANGSSVLAGSV